MPSNPKRQKHARILRIFRSIHRQTGAVLFVFFAIIAISGLGLGIKKHSNGILLPDTQQGTSSELSEWLPLDSLTQIAIHTLNSELGPGISSELDRIDIRKNKGILKFTFKGHLTEVQLDGVTGIPLSTGKRYSDWLEDLHDGSLLDDLLGLSGEPVKVTYTIIMGLSLLSFTITGFWLWYGPKYLKKLRTLPQV